ncbi:MAG: DUF1648 domain-containing protein [Aureliella sp.]
MFTDTRRSVLLLTGLVACSTVIAIVQNAWYWQQLPVRVATHFGFDGEPNAWMSRNAATAMMLALQIGLPLFLTGLGASMRWLPPSLINIPNRQYWFEPERRESTLQTMRLLTTLIALLTSLFLIWLSHLTFRANMTDGRLPLRDGLGGVVLYLVAVFTIVAISFWRFRRP